MAEIAIRLQIRRRVESGAGAAVFSRLLELGEPAVDELHAHGALADGGGDALRAA